MASTRFAQWRVFEKFLVALAVSVVMFAAACGGSGSPSAVSSGSATAVASLPFDRPANLIQPGTILAATSGTSPPHTALDANGNLQGYAIDRCNAIAKRLGLQIKYITIDFGSTLAGLSAGRFDMTCTSVNRTTERLASTEFLMTNGTVQQASTIVVRADDTRFKSLSDAKGKIMGGVRGGAEPVAIAKYLNNDVEVRDYPGITELILDLKNKRIDCYGTNLLGAAYQVKNDPGLRLGDSAGISPITAAEAVRKEEPDLLKAVNSVELEMRNSGEIAALQMKWYGVVSLPPTP